MTPWQPIHDRYWGGMTNPALKAFELRLGVIALIVFHDHSGWAFKCSGVIGETRLDHDVDDESDAKQVAQMELRRVLGEALDHMDAVEGVTAGAD